MSRSGKRSKWKRNEWERDYSSEKLADNRISVYLNIKLHIICFYSSIFLYWRPNHLELNKLNLEMT